jgi:molecular chaperone GrpE (heat shock protein)
MDYWQGRNKAVQIALEERTTGHVSYTNTESVLDILQEIDSSNISSRGLEMLERIRTTFDFLKDNLDKVDPWLVPESTMTNINSPISQVLSELINFKNDKNEQRLNNVFSYLEGILVYLSQLVVSKTPEDIEGVRQSTIKFRQSVGQHLGHVERDLTETSTALNKNTEKLNDLTASIESQKTRIDSIVSEFQSQFLQAQTQRNEEFSTLIKKGEQDFIRTIKSFEESFEQQTTTQQESFDSLTKGFQQQIETQQDSFDTLIVDFKDKAQSELDQMNEMNKKAEKLLGIMSMKGLAQGYQKIANKEGWKAFGWNAISIFSLLAILWFGYEFIIQHEGEMSWTALISRMVLTGVGITLFTYSAKHETEG